MISLFFLGDLKFCNFCDFAHKIYVIFGHILQDVVVNQKWFGPLSLQTSDGLSFKNHACNMRVKRTAEKTRLFYWHMSIYAGDYRRDFWPEILKVCYAIYLAIFSKM